MVTTVNFCIRTKAPHRAVSSVWTCLKASCNAFDGPFRAFGKIVLPALLAVSLDLPRQRLPFQSL